VNSVIIFYSLALFDYCLFVFYYPFVFIRVFISLSLLFRFHSSSAPAKSAVSVLFFCWSFQSLCFCFAIRCLRLPFIFGSSHSLTEFQFIFVSVAFVGFGSVRSFGSFVRFGALSSFSVLPYFRFQSFTSIPFPFRNSKTSSHFRSLFGATPFRSALFFVPFVVLQFHFQSFCVPFGI